MGTTTSSIFTGSSQFSTDFQNVITRAVNIASLPLTLLNNQLAAEQSQSSALTGIDSKFASLQSAVQGIQNAMGSASYQATVSDTKVATATVSDGAVEGSYTLDVIDPGAYSTSLTATSWDSTPSVPHTYQLWVGGTDVPANEIDITPADNTAKSVAAAINAQAGDKVRATAVNVGSTAAPDWRISLQGATLGDAPVDIQDGGSSLQTQTAGREAQYIVNNSGITASSASRAVTIADGVTVNLLSGDSGSPVSISVTHSSSALSTALANFATAYNAAVDAMDAQSGQASGSLNGDSTLRNLKGIATQLSTYSSAGNEVSGLRDLGLELGADGHLTVNSKLPGADLSNSAAVAAFLGSTTGSGFLKTATDLLNGVEDSTSGMLKNAEASMTSQIANTNNRISTQQDHVDQLQQRLQAQMAAADAAIASMEQQYSYLSNLFAAMQTADQMYK